MKPEDLPHLTVFERGVFPQRVVEMAEIAFKGGRSASLYVAGIQKDCRPGEWNLVHALTYDKNWNILEPSNMRNAMLEEIVSYRTIENLQRQ